MFLTLYLSGNQVEMLDIRTATCTVYNEICFEDALFPIAGGMNQQPVPGLLNRIAGATVTSRRQGSLSQDTLSFNSLQ